MLVLSSGFPAVAAACSVCGPGADDVTRKAFLDSTIFLSLLPLAAMGAVAVWIWRRAHATETRSLPTPR